MKLKKNPKNDQQQKRAANSSGMSARTEKVRHSFSIAKQEANAA